MKSPTDRILGGIVLCGMAVCIIYTDYALWGWLSLLFFGSFTIAYIVRLRFPNVKWLRWFKMPTETEEDDRPFDEIYNDTGIFEYLDDSFKISFKDGPLQVKWNEIESIFAYKIDLFAYDNICCDVFYDAVNGFTINEETRGWYQFLLHLNKNLPQVDESWWVEISTPAFETKLTLIYDKQGRSQDQVMKQYYKD